MGMPGEMQQQLMLPPYGMMGVTHEQLKAGMQGYNMYNVSKVTFFLYKSYF